MVSDGFGVYLNVSLRMSEEDFMGDSGRDYALRRDVDGDEYNGDDCCVSKLLRNKMCLLVLVLGYALLGAALFKALEGGGRESGAVPAQVQKSRDDCLRELWLITERLNVLYEKNWTKLVTEQLKHFERVVVEYSGGTDGGDPSTTGQWSFGGALLYCLTLLTTIGYGRLSPKTAPGKVAAILYALVGVPLMLVLLSALGSLLAAATRKLYWKLCCCCGGAHKVPKNCYNHAAVGYHKAPTHPAAAGLHSSRLACKSILDECTIQIANNTPTHNTSCLNNKHSMEYADHLLEAPKKTILATVRTSHARGRCRQLQVRQMLADPQLCPAHPRRTQNSFGFLTGSDIEDPEDSEDTDHGSLHDTPSRVPLICHQSQEPTDVHHSPQCSTATVATTPSVPTTIVILIFTSYVLLGAAAFASASGWSFLDAAYFCFIALTTIGLGDRLPHSPEMNVQMQMLACCAYLFVGLVVLAMCFSLVHEDVANKCRQFAVHFRLVSRK